MENFIKDPIVQMYIVFILFFIIPLIPSILIYKLFPDTKVSASGPFSGLNLKTSGAFAAYICTLIAGVFIINNTIDLIKTNSTWKQADFLWKVKSNFIIQEGDKTLSNSEAWKILDSMDTYFDPKPSWIRNSGDGYIVYVPNSLVKDNVTIVYSADECNTVSITPNEKKYNKDNENKIISVGNLIMKKSESSTSTYNKNIQKEQSEPPNNFQ